MKKNPQNGEKTNIFERIKSFFLRKKHADVVSDETLNNRELENLNDISVVSDELGALADNTSETTENLVVDSQSFGLDACESDNDFEQPLVDKSLEQPLDNVETLDTDSSSDNDASLLAHTELDNSLDSVNIVASSENIDNSSSPLASEENSTLTPQQEYVACRNINVSVNETVIKSFVAKLISIDDELKGYYSDLKNYALSFVGTRYRTSWQYDSIYKTKILLARFVIKGKSLWIYVALSPEDVPEGMNFVTTKDKKYEGLEVGLKIQGARTFKQAKNLLSLACTKAGLIYSEKTSENFIPDSMTDDELFERGLIKKIITSTNPK